jgi:hypothetical protein
MMQTTLSPFLRCVLLADAAVSGATGLLMFLGAGFLAGLLSLPEELLRPTGLFLLPYSALVAYIATRVSPPLWSVWLVIIANTLWALDSIMLLLTGWVEPNTLGYTFIILQAVVVAGFAEAQYIGLRQSMKAVA